MAILIKNQKFSPKELVAVARNYERLEVSPGAKAKVLRARKVIEKAVEDGKIIYGITTGFGAFKNTVISKEQTSKLQENLILSHSVGVGNYFPTEVVRGLMFLMINYLSKGFSGIRWETINTLRQMLNKRVHPLVPEKGSVGSSGDLAPSAHIALVLIGKGEAEYLGKNMTGKKALAKAGIKPIVLSAKEGLAIINNTSTMSSIASLAISDAGMIIEIGDLCGALSLQALMGTAKAYDKRIHQIKPHDGQIKTAENLRSLLEGSKLVDETRIQEAYSFRCIPQIHGAIREAL